MPRQSVLFDHVELTGISMPFSRNEEIFGEAEPAEYIYKVLSGSVRSYRLLSDGRRRVNGFYLVGDVFGLEFGLDHSYFAEAVDDCVILLVKRSTLLRIAESDRCVSWQLLSIVNAELDRSRNHGMLLVKSARERLAAFLLEMAGRMTDKGSVELPMSRQDIADYLGLTIETVSRTLTQLAQSSKIKLVKARQVVLQDRNALAVLNS
jgi:CRP-like cAMP-binding protein